MIRFVFLSLVLTAVVYTYFHPQLLDFKPPVVESQNITLEIPESVIDKPKHITKSEVYKWTDSEGNTHYSDRSDQQVALPKSGGNSLATSKNTNQHQVKKIIIKTETTEFAKSPTIKPIYIESRQNRGGISRTSRCKNLRNKLSKAEKRSRKAGRIPSGSNSISKQRWKIIKNC